MRVVMDAAGDLPATLASELNIHIVPVYIIFGTEEFLSGITIDHATFYEKVKSVEAHNFPKSSQPTPYQFEQAYRSIIEEGEEEIIAVIVSKRLSGTYASAVAGARALEGEAIHVFDSGAGSALQGWMAVEAARMARAGADSGAILARLEAMRDTFSIYFLIDSLEYAVKGGRVSALRSTLASLLNIKPIMKVEEGLIVEGGRVRTYKKALSYIVDAIYNEVEDRPVKLAVVHSESKANGEMLLQRARARFNVTEDFMSDMALSVAVNLGPGALGLVAIPETEGNY